MERPMSKYEVILHISDGLTLGHVLMTKGVEMIHIKEFENEKRSIKQKSRETSTHFKHPSGKTISKFIEEYMLKQTLHVATWKNLNVHIKSLGFARSSLNNSLKYLMKNEIIVREKVGVFKLIEKK
jgi:hypothetical protein